MKTLLEIFKSTWYIWALFFAASILKLFMPKIKGYFGEKAVAFFLSKLDKIFEFIFKGVEFICQRNHSIRSFLNIRYSNA